jgi:hypothetical protein
MSENNDGNGNGAVHPTPAERAWETARQRAREQGQSVRDEEIRCIKTKGMSAWAKLLYWILSKICWEASPLLHNRRVGSVCVTGGQLKKFFGFPSKRLYSQTKKLKDKSGAVVTTRRVPGAIQELVTAGFIWMSHKEIRNIPSNKWPNVFNLLVLVPQTTQPNLGLLEGVVIADEADTNGGASDFFAEKPNGACQPLQNGPAKHQRGCKPTPASGGWQGPTGGVAKHPLWSQG